MGTKKITALYIRVSTDRQYEEGYSIEAQQKKLEQWCKLKDIHNYKFYIDGGWSGSNIDRPQITKLISDITKNKIQNIVVYKLDRLSRSQKDTIFLLEDIFIPNNVNFISLNENFDTTTPYGKAMIGILSVFAQLERENIRERTRMGMYERVKKGLWMGGGRVPFGYKYDQNKNILVPDPETAPQVKQIFDLYLQGYSTTRLAQMFDVASDRHITQIIGRVTYLGKIKYNGETIDGQHEPIIDEETFEKAQIMQKRRSTKSLVTSTYLFTSLVYCGKCGAKYRYQKWGKDKVKLYCYSQQHSKPNLIKDPNCDNKRIDADVFERIVLEDLFNVTDNYNATSSVVVKRTSSAEAMKQRYDVISNKLKRLYNLYATNGNELLLDTIKENEDELKSLKKKIEHEKVVAKITEEINNKKAQTEELRGLRSNWKYMSILEQQEAIRICIDKIIITDEKIDIHYNL